MAIHPLYQSMPALSAPLPTTAPAPALQPSPSNLPTSSPAPALQQSASRLTPIQALRPSTPPLPSLTELADQLVRVDQYGSGIPAALSAILGNTSYGPGDPPVTTLEGLRDSLYGTGTDYSVQRLQTAAVVLRNADAQLQQQQAQIEMLKKQLAGLAELARQGAPLQTAQPTLPTTQPTPTTQPSQGPNWGTIAVSLGILAVLGIGAWYVMTHKRRTATEPAEPKRIFPPPARRRA